MEDKENRRAHTLQKVAELLSDHHDSLFESQRRNRERLEKIRKMKAEQDQTQNAAQPIVVKSG